MHEHERPRSPENAQAPQDLVELEQIGFGDLLIGGHNDDVVDAADPRFKSGSASA